uniref:OTU domain-containing protein n=2 Tax=Brassica campestris TaxID=3711 RepID=A0A3P5ZGC2_BRACM|nr:unnamed protein product [Brassica rapa]
MDERNRNTFATASGGAGGSTSASSNSSFSSSVADTEDDQTIARILTEDDSLRREGMLGKRLSHLDSIPHTPRVNNQIPDINDATLDHELLSVRLATYGLAELQMEGDALADQLFRNPDYHKHVRKHIVKQVLSQNHTCAFFQLKRQRKLYEGYVPMKYRHYTRKMKKPGEWGDHVTLQAAADRFEAKICLVTSFREQSYIEILPHNKNPLKEAWLSFWSEVHYNSLYSSGDVPTRQYRKKHWLF